MKFFFCCIALLWGTVLCAPGALADTVSYELDEVGISLDIPENLDVYTRDNLPEMGEKTALGSTPAQLLQSMKKANGYLVAVNQNMSYLIYVTMERTGGFDFDEISEEVLEQTRMGLIERNQEKGIETIDSCFYQHKQKKFIKFLLSSRTESGDFISVLQYCTIFDGKAVSLSISVAGGIIYNELAAMMQDMIDSVVFLGHLVRDDVVVGEYQIESPQEPQDETDNLSVDLDHYHPEVLSFCILAVCTAPGLWRLYKRKRQASGGS